MQQGVFDINLQKIANVIPTAAVKQSTKVLGPLVFFYWGEAEALYSWAYSHMINGSTCPERSLSDCHDCCKLIQPVACGIYLYYILPGNPARAFRDILIVLKYL